MPKTVVLKPREVVQILEKNGFVFIRQSGSHQTYRNALTKKTTVVPFHSKDLAIGILKVSLNSQPYPKKHLQRRGKGNQVS